jgi:hypothetical protein
LGGAYEGSNIEILRNALVKAGSEEVKGIVQQQLDRWK